MTREQRALRELGPAVAAPVRVSPAVKRFAALLTAIMFAAVIYSWYSWWIGVQITAAFQDSVAEVSSVSEGAVRNTVRVAVTRRGPPGFATCVRTESFGTSPPTEYWRCTEPAAVEPVWRESRTPAAAVLDTARGQLTLTCGDAPPGMLRAVLWPRQAVPEPATEQEALFRCLPTPAQRATSRDPGMQR